MLAPGIIVSLSPLLWLGDAVRDFGDLVLPAFAAGMLTLVGALTNLAQASVSKERNGRRRRSRLRKGRRREGESLRGVILEHVTTSLIGVWRLLSFEDREDETSEWVSYGPDPQGVIIYHPTGVISVHLVAEGPLPSMEGYVGYWGTYRVVDARRQADEWVGTIEHYMQGGSMAELFEEGSERPFVLSGDRLMLGDGRTARRLLERINDRPGSLTSGAS